MAKRTGQALEDRLVRMMHFGPIGLDNVDWFCLKCDPGYALELREHYTGITGAWHWNKKYWNQVSTTHGDVPDALVRHLIDHSYDEVVKKLPRKLRVQLDAE